MPIGFLFYFFEQSINMLLQLAKRDCRSAMHLISVYFFVNGEAICKFNGKSFTKFAFKQ